MHLHRSSLSRVSLLTAGMRSAALLGLGLCTFGVACGPPPDDAPAIITSITGRVLDADGNAIANALVETEPFVKQAFTNTEGRYTIDEGLAVAATYRVSASKAGYQDNSVTITNVREGENTVADIRLEELGPELELSLSTLQFNSGESAATFRVENVGDTSQPLTFNVSSAQDWVTEISPDSGSVTDTAKTISVRIDRTMLSAGMGDVSGAVEVTSNGGSATVAITVIR